MSPSHQEVTGQNLKLNVAELANPEGFVAGSPQWDECCENTIKGIVHSPNRYTRFSAAPFQTKIPPQVLLDCPERRGWNTLMVNSFQLPAKKLVLNPCMAELVDATDSSTPLMLVDGDSHTQNLSLVRASRFDSGYKDQFIHRPVTELAYVSDSNSEI